MIRRLCRRPPFCSWLCYFLVFTFASVIILLLYLIQSESPLEFRLDPRFQPSPFSEKIEAVVDPQVDGMTGIFGEASEPPYSCRMPEIDPFDKSILGLIDHPRSVKCRRVQPDFAFVDDDGRLKLNSSAVKKFETDQSTNVSCYYKYFDRGDTDRDLIYDPDKPLIKAVKLKRPFVKVYCNHGVNSSRIYVNIFSYPVLAPRSISSNQSTPHQPLSPNGNDLSVFIFVLESTSASMVYRHLPKTLHYLNDSGAIIFKNVLKVGENTLPNLAAMFTGRRYRQEQEDMPAELTVDDGYFDHWPFIWKRYRQEQGYETVYVEDAPHIGTFHYNAKGFKQKPVDHWYFPFWYAQSKQGWPVTASSRFCFGNEPMYKIHIDILRRHLEKARGRRQFLFTIFNDLSHDYDSDLERADDTWFDFFQRLDSSRSLNRTIVIVMGDHGPRFTKIRQTAVGFAEERLPFLSIRIPPHMYVRFPDLLSTLTSNAQNRLVSWFDLHETLLDILSQKYSGAPIEDPSIRGRSLFRPLPADRTCYQAGIPDRYCLCDGYTITPRRHKVAAAAAKTVLAEVNKMVKKYRDQCASWKLDKLLYFLRVPWPGEVAGETKTYFLAFRAKPLNGMFEGVVIRNLTDDSIRFKPNTLERINAFGHYGNCLMKVKLWKWCACRQYVHD